MNDYSLEKTNDKIIGFDNLNNHYVFGIKTDCLEMIAKTAGERTAANGLGSFSCGSFAFIRADLVDEDADTLQLVLVEEGVLPADFDFEAHKELVPMQPGDVPITYADTSALERDFGYCLNTPLEDGLRQFAKRNREYYGI